MPRRLSVVKVHDHGQNWSQSLSVFCKLNMEVHMNDHFIFTESTEREVAYVLHLRMSIQQTAWMHCRTVQSNRLKHYQVAERLEALASLLFESSRRHLKRPRL